MKKDQSCDFNFFSMNPEDCPYFLITRVSLCATAAFKRGFAEAGLTDMRPAYLGALMSLWEEDGLKVTELGRRAGLEPSTMTGLIDRMERDGLVQRVFDPSNRRELKIHLTDAGRAIKDTVASTVESILKKVLTGLKSTEIEQMKGTLRKILMNVHEEEENEQTDK
ncbi:MAG: MarR family winged helix-turn-helix transcriptional regulator [Syntrophales bacterium]